VIYIASVEVRGESERGRFSGRLPDRDGGEFSPGLQVISGNNYFGKTLAARAIAWCLNLEAMFGRKDSDQTFFPHAGYDDLDIDGHTSVRVLSSEAHLVLVRDDGERLELTRGITHDRNKLRIWRHHASGEDRLTLLTGPGSMTEQTTGFQRYLFEWFRWPVVQITSYEGGEPFIYAENLGPLFFVEQDEGWTEVQARQVGRYGQQQIRELAVEYLLGAVDAVRHRVSRLKSASIDVSLRTAARTLADRVQHTMLRRGWAVDWSGGGSVQEIEGRWSALSIRGALLRDAKIDLDAQRRLINDRIAALRKALDLPGFFGPFATGKWRQLT
jgi:hypothetical protein